MGLIGKNIRITGKFEGKFPQKPIANFTQNEVSGTAPFAVVFTDQTTGAIGTSWLWDFGDGSTSTQVNPTKVYNDPGTFTVTLTVSNSAGSSTITKTNLISVASSNPELFSLILTGDGANNANNSTIIDSSSNNLTIGSNGSYSQGNFSPFSNPVGYWSTNFDGTNSWLTVSSNAATNLYGGRFTIEFWICPLGLSASDLNYVVCQDDGTSNSQNFILRLLTTGAARFTYYTSSSRSSAVNLTTNTTISTNLWTHVAVVNDNSTVKIYLNGTESASSSSMPWAGANIQTAVGNLSSGSNQTTTNSKLNAYVTNLRLVKGTAVYTSNFTPSLSPLTAITNTALLITGSNRFVDRSTNNFAVSISGNISISPFSAFSLPPYNASAMGGSILCNGSYFSAPDTGNLFDMGGGEFTYESWIYPATTGFSQGQGLFGKAVDSFTYAVAVRLFWWNDGLKPRLMLNLASSNPVTIDTVSTVGVTPYSWNHVALVRTGNTLKLFINGVEGINTGLSGTIADNSASFTVGSQTQNGIGALSNAYLSNVRVVKGTAMYTTAFPNNLPTAPVTAVTGTSLLLNGTNAGITDQTRRNVLLPVNVSLSNLQELPAYSTSARLTGSASYFVVPTSQLLNMLDSSFTIECYLYVTGSMNGAIFGKRADSNTFGGVILDFDPILSDNTLPILYPRLRATTNGTSWGVNATSSVPLLTNFWNHVAVTRSGNTWRIFINGTVASTSTLSGSIPNNTAAFTIGAGAADGSNVLTAAYIQDFKVTRGLARYTGNFIPSQERVPGPSFTSNVTVGAPTLSVSFTDTTLANPTSWLWNFGNGQTSTAQNPTATYASTGTYSVTLTASNANGTATTTATNYVTVTNSTVPSTLQAVVVAGGGGGGWNGVASAGGGGAGGVLYTATMAIVSGRTYTVTVGAGGGPGTGVVDVSGVAGVTGGNSSFTGTGLTVTALGGGGGGSQWKWDRATGANSGGSGGGGASNYYGTSGVGSGTAGQGNAGGNGSAWNGNSYGGGGGGGAGTAGIAATTSTGGSGRNYLGTIYGGGGGGGNTGSPPGGAGGIGGGGRGFGNGTVATNGAINTGGGGGASATGGSGIVVIRYPSYYADAASTTGSPSYTNSGGFKTYIFTQSGTIRF